MGNFGGHALPGSFFIAFGIWWTIQAFYRYFRSQVKGGLPFKSSATFPCSCLCGRLKTWEIEGAVKMFFTTVGFTLEIITAFKDGKFTYLGNGQHATMFFFFWMSGLVDILVNKGVPLPKGIEYIMMALAVIIEGLLFKFHLHGRDDMDVLLHTLLLYAIYASVIAVFLEMRFRHNILATLTRAFFVLLQGTWFWQVAFILYNPVPGATDWDHKSQDQMTIITMIFAWHMGAIAALMLATGAAISCLMRCNGYFDSPYDTLNMNLIKRDSNGHTVINLREETDSELEFERPLTRDSR